MTNEDRAVVQSILYEAITSILEQYDMGTIEMVLTAVNHWKLNEQRERKN